MRSAEEIQQIIQQGNSTQEVKEAEVTIEDVNDWMGFDQYKPRKPRKLVEIVPKDKTLYICVKVTDSGDDYPSVTKLGLCMLTDGGERRGLETWEFAADTLAKGVTRYDTGHNLRTWARVCELMRAFNLEYPSSKYNLVLVFDNIKKSSIALDFSLNDMCGVLSFEELFDPHLRHITYIDLQTLTTVTSSLIMSSIMCHVNLMYKVSPGFEGELEQMFPIYDAIIGRLRE
jgi:hypothetical protein